VITHVGDAAEDAARLRVMHDPDARVPERRAQEDRLDSHDEIRSSISRTT
jgi:hypothetical protein